MRENIVLTLLFVQCYIKIVVENLPTLLSTTKEMKNRTVNYLEVRDSRTGNSALKLNLNTNVRRQYHHIRKMAFTKESERGRHYCASCYVIRNLADVQIHACEKLSICCLLCISKVSSPYLPHCRQSCSSMSSSNGKKLLIVIIIASKLIWSNQRGIKK